MAAVDSLHQEHKIETILNTVSAELTADDESIFQRIVSSRLSSEQEQAVLTPSSTFPKQREVLAVHWHPEHVPLDLVEKRLDIAFPEKQDYLIIPTQHNMIMKFENYYGVEVDCYSQAFNQKVQLLIHFKAENLSKAEKLTSMVDHTFMYRASQLSDFISTIVSPNWPRLESAARETGTGKSVIQFVRTYVEKIKNLIDRNEQKIEPAMIKNKLLRNFFDNLRPIYGDFIINKAQAFLKAVKLIVKADFPLTYFYRTSEIIEEARSIGAGIVIPHPEQFWPILLADYDVDGYEVWNPQSRKYTEFLISVVDRKNKSLDQSARQLLIFMGDDTHMGEKVRDPALQDKTKASREIGYQPAWDELSICKRLILADMSRKDVIRRYQDRLNG